MSPRDQRVWNSPFKVCPLLREDGEDVSGPVQKEASGRGTDGMSVLIHLMIPAWNWIYSFFHLDPSLLSLVFHLLTSASLSPFFKHNSFFFFFKLFIYLFIYLWLRWVFVSAWGLSLLAASGGHSSSRCAGLSLSRTLLLQSTGSRCAGSVVVAHGPSCSAACGIFPDQGLNPCPLHWQADFQPLRHQGSP